MHFLAKPSNFIRLYRLLLPWLIAAASGLLIFGLWQALIVSPPDYQQGDTVRIMYIHVPSAWMAMGIYVGMAISSAMYLIWKHPLADSIARQSALLGAGFTLICLVTGSLWGRPMWGAYWVWDARLTSVLVLFFLYIGYMALSDAYDGKEQGKKLCAILVLVGFVNIPVIRFSVDWWNTLHQPASVVREGGIAIHLSMQLPLFSMGLAFFALYLMLLGMRVETDLLRQKIRRLQAGF